METRTRYLAARVWDGTGPLVRHGAVEVDGAEGTITAVGAVEAMPQPAPHTRVQDLGDVTLLPGLIDAHVHVTFSAGLHVVDDFMAERDTAGQTGLLHRAHANLATALAAGVTTVRDLGTPAVIATHLRDELARGDIAGPSFVTSASPLTTPGGHCHFLSHEVAADDDPAAAVDTAVEAGADLVKVFASGGNLTPGSSPLARQFDRDALAAMVRAAHRRGLVVAAHAHGAESVADCVAVGVDTIEHCGFVTPDGPRADPAVLARMAADGGIATPTIGAGPSQFGDIDPEMIPPAIRDKVLLLIRQWPMVVDVVKATVDAGVQITCGTDAGIPRRGFDAIHGALAYFCADDGLGMTPTEALATATSIAARACGLEDRGLLRTGLRADLLAVDGDPLHTITDLTRTRLVVLAGREVTGRAAPAPA